MIINNLILKQIIPIKLKYKQFVMSNNNTKLLLNMEGQLEYFNLNSISLPYNFLIFGANSINYSLMSIIKHVLNSNDCITNYVNINQNMCVEYFSEEHRRNGRIIIYDKLEDHPEYFDSLDTIFIHSQYINKESVMKKFLGNHPINNLANYSCSDTFFVLKSKSIFKVYKIEHCLGYLKTFGDKPYDYNNITKLTNNILNNFSVYYKINGELHLILQSRLDQLNQIYNGILCLKNNSVWIPYELNLEIIKLLFLLY